MMRSKTFPYCYQAVIDSPIPHVNALGLRLNGRRISSLDLLPHESQRYVEPEASSAVSALNEYFANYQDFVQLQVEPTGTPFQQRVWRALRAIPFGQVRRYGELAGELNTSARAVANACRANPLPLLVPCHRVVSVSGPGGYMGKTEGASLAIKLWLLQHEGYV